MVKQKQKQKTPIFSAVVFQGGKHCGVLFHGLSAIFSFS